MRYLSSNKDTLKTLRLVNHLFYDIVSPALFKTVTIPASRAPAIEVMTGIASSNVGAHIKEFAIPVACMFDELGDPSSYVHPSMVQLQEWVNQLQGPLEGLFKASATSLRKLSISEDSISILIEDFPDDYDPIVAFYLLLGFAIDRTNIPVDNIYLQTARLQFSAQLWTKNLVRGLSTVNIKMVQSDYDNVDDHETFDMTALDQLTSRFLNDAENLHSFSADCNNGISFFLYRLELSDLLAKNLRHLSLTDIVIDQDFATNLGYLQQLHALKLDHSLASNIIPEFRWHDVFRALCSIHSLKLMQFSALDYFATILPPATLRRTEWGFI